MILIEHSPFIQWQNSRVEYSERRKILGQNGIVIWFTGLSGAGKSTIGIELERRLFDIGRIAYRLDGDNIRHGLCSDLGFSKVDRMENIRRLAEVAVLLKDAALIVIVCAISPLEENRKLARSIVGDEFFVEVYVKADVETCARRDPKGLYSLAHKGIITNLTGISSPFQEPMNPDLVVDTRELTIDQSVTVVMDQVCKILNSILV